MKISNILSNKLKFFPIKTFGRVPNLINFKNQSSSIYLIGCYNKLF